MRIQGLVERDQEFVHARARFAERARPPERGLRLVNRTVHFDRLGALREFDPRSRDPVVPSSPVGCKSSRVSVVKPNGTGILDHPMELAPRPPFARPRADDPYLKALSERVVIFDGATGTNLQLRQLSADDFGGANLEGCNELLVATRPDVIESLHRSFFDVGVDARDRLLWGRSPWCLRNMALPIGLASSPSNPRASPGGSPTATPVPGEPKFVAGSIGPGTKFPTLGQITYDDLSASYEELALRPPRRRRGPPPCRNHVRPALG